MLLISSNRSGRPEAPPLWVRCGVSVACLLGGLLRTSVYLRASSQHFAGRLFAQLGRPGCAQPLRFHSPIITPARLGSPWLTFSTRAARKNFPVSRLEVKVTQSGTCLFEYPSSEACLEAGGWGHCWITITKLSRVPHLQLHFLTALSHRHEMEVSQWWGKCYEFDRQPLTDSQTKCTTLMVPLFLSSDVIHFTAVNLMWPWGCF